MARLGSKVSRFTRSSRERRGVNLMPACRRARAPMRCRPTVLDASFAERADLRPDRAPCRRHKPAGAEGATATNVSQAVLKQGCDACLVGRLPAAEIEAAVIDQVRGLLRAPEIVVGTFRAPRRTASSSFVPQKFVIRVSGLSSRIGRLADAFRWGRHHSAIARTR